MSALDTTIVLCAGSLNTTNLPIGTNASNAMVPVNGKPVIGWILDDLVRKGILAVTVVVRQENERLRLFLTRAYDSRLRVTIVPLEREGSILDSLDAGLRHSPSDGVVRIILGDTLIVDPFESDVDFVYAGEVEDSRRWCVLRLDTDGRVVDYLHKQELSGSRHLVAAGYYHLRDGPHLQECVTACLSTGERELSDALTRYSGRHPIVAKRAEQWYDFGHIDNFTRARRDLLQPRSFNSLHVNPVLNTITKISTDDQKLEDELSWYLTIPDELKVLTPRIVSHRRRNGCLEIVQEYYGYPTLAELFVYGDLPADAWRSILRRVLQVHEEFRRHLGAVTAADVLDMYVTKTKRRLKELADADPWWAGLLEAPEVTFNNTRLRNVPALLAEIESEAARLAAAPVAGIIHGDLCFSNILFDFNNQIIRLIDPRGRFGRPGIHGDARYDMAKLRHSVHGLYDFITADMFQIDVGDGGANGRVFADGVPQAVGANFDCMLREAGYDVRAIQFIEGLLFLSMVPLHHNQPRRQQIMYYTGVRLLNEVL